MPAIKVVVLDLVPYCSLARLLSFSPSRVLPFSRFLSLRRQTAAMNPEYRTISPSLPSLSLSLALHLCVSLESCERAAAVCANANLSPGHVPLRSELRARPWSRQEARVAT